MVGERRQIPVLPLDSSFLDLEEEEAEFFKSLTRITNDEELRKHIIDVAAKAYGVSALAVKS